MSNNSTNQAFYTPSREDVHIALIHRAAMNAAFKIRKRLLDRMRSSGKKWSFDSEGLCRGEENLITELEERFEAFGDVLLRNLFREENCCHTNIHLLEDIDFVDPR